MSWIEKIWPSPCAICSATASHCDFCDDCRYELPYNTTFCRRCAEPLPVSSVVSLCRRCLVETPVYDKARIPLRYEFPINSLILIMKNGDLSSCRILSRLFLSSAQLPDKLPQVLIPVPMDWHRQRQRGFNQSLELSRYLGRALNIPVDPWSCTKPAPTPPQQNLNALQRRKNLRHAFHLKHPTPRYQHLAIVDDVVTTGATSTEVSTLFRRAGVEHIEIWAIARS